ncbi:hypothetical protein BUALT_Bualt11G0128400 [Buddleja alternifolia]|uniref:Uncharacterized protein n=1 Tax=Buddleja alternifolia TaxID=168488 RepID=A0AAV6WZE7_9LAMI|nr:hypothetical protein BUALT_Bualt11G0128400 [Buddleja alternifolia]
MAASVQFRPQNRDLGVVMREVDEDLAIFLGMQNVEKERNEELDDSKDAEPKLDSSFTSDPMQISADDNFLNLEIEKNDYDWLATLPDSSLLPSVEVGVQDSEAVVSNGEAISLKSEAKSAPVGDNPSQLTKSTTQRPLSSSSSRDRKPTPGRPIVPAKSKGSRASTPTSRAVSRSSTPGSRPSIPVISSKSASRSSTPTRKPSTPTMTPAVSSTIRSSSGRKMGPVAKNPVPFRGTSPTVKSRPSKPSDNLSLSHDATQIPKISMPKRPSSASRGRPSGPATHLPSSNGKPRQKSCSPAKVRVPNNNVTHKSGSKMISRSRGYINGGDDVNPVLMGTKMVERVVNMRKLAPPKQDEYVSHDNVKKSCGDKGFGRSLSKKSLDMAIRHMDIRRSIPDNLRPLATGFQSGSGKSSSFDVSSSQTSSTDSSRSSICINSYILNRNEIE